MGTNCHANFRIKSLRSAIKWNYYDSDITGAQEVEEGRGRRKRNSETHKTGKKTTEAVQG